MVEWKRAERVVGSPARAVVLLVALASALLLTAGASGRAAMQVFTDPDGDATGAVDFRSLSIGDSGGILTFKLVMTGMKFTAGSGVKETDAFLDLDTNKDGKRDYTLWIGNDADGFGWDLDSANGKSVPQSPSMGYVRSGDAYTIKVGSSDIGGATSFDVWVTVGSVDDTGAAASTDDAPDGGAWSYTMTSVKPVIGEPTTSPLNPIAGKAFTLTVPVTRSDSGARLTIGTMTSDLRLGAQPLVHSQTFKNGTAAVHLTVPASARGKVMRVRIVIASGGQSVTRTTSIHVA